MSRKRYITTAMSSDGKVIRLAGDDQTAALMWPWFVANLDDWARMSADPLETKVNIFGAFDYTPEKIQAAMTLYHQRGLAVLYTVGEHQYLQANPASFYELNSYVPRSKQSHDSSKIPPPPDHPWRKHWRTSAWNEMGIRSSGSAPVAHNATESQSVAQSSAEQHEMAPSSEESRTVAKNAPSPSPSPSPSKTNTKTKDIAVASGESTATIPRSSPKRRNSESAWSPEQRALAKLIYDHRMATGDQPDNRFFGVQAGTAADMLRRHPLEWWVACLEWGKTHTFHRDKLSNLGYLSRSVAPQYAQTVYNGAATSTTAVQSATPAGGIAPEEFDEIARLGNLTFDSPADDEDVPF